MYTRRVLEYCGFYNYINDVMHTILGVHIAHQSASTPGVFLVCYRHFVFYSVGLAVTNSRK